MPQLPFKPAPGLFTDSSSFSANGGIIDCSNVRWWEGRWQVIGGWTQRGTLAMSSTPNKIHDWATSTGGTYIAWGGQSSLQIETGGTLYDILPSGTSGTRRWCFSNYGDTLIASLSGAKTYQWNLNTATPAIEVTNAPIISICTLVTPQRQLLTFGCNEEISGSFNGRCIRGSDIEDITNWTTTSTNNAFEQILDGSSTTIVGARLVGDYVAVWNSTELWMGQFIGDPGQTYRFERAGSDCGLLFANAVVVVGTTAYWMTPDLRFMTWQPGSEPTQIPCPLTNFLRRQFPTSLSRMANTFAAYVAKFNEVWFHYDDPGPPIYHGRYVAFSLSDGHWFKGGTERRAMNQGPSGLLAALNNGNLINCETGLIGNGTSVTSLAWSITSSDIYLDSGQRRMMIRSLRTDFSEQSGNVTISIKAKNYPNDSYVTKALTATPATRKLDFRQGGRLISVVIAGDDGSAATNTFVRQGLPVLDLVPMGER